jgi:hypothetical protein
MAARHITARGEHIDMEMLRMANAETVALGNARKNARGDALGPGGTILKTQEQIEAEWAASKARTDAQARPSDIKGQAMAKMVAKPAPQEVIADDANWEPEVEQPKPATVTRRRITEAE